ncbi:MAG: hypothetical protein KDA22_00805, partial [Phycisphaerales bacterium]|nr:hypothetical protein [Phycisphaerales bacterium]
SCGRIAAPAPLPPRETGALLAVTTLDARSTLYARIGEAWGWSALALTAALLLGTIRRRRSDPNMQTGARS